MQIDLIVSIADKIASLLVRGLLESGTFSILVVIWPNLPRAVISWVFFVVFGSAIIFTIVSWLPNPDILSKAETLIFFGNNLTASLAVPSKIVEWYGRNYTQNYIQFLRMAGGSLLELETRLIISKELKLIGSKLYQKAQRLIVEENKMLNAFIKSISNKK